MASASDDDVFDDFLSEHGQENEPTSWVKEYNKKQCPDCGGLHELAATECSVCGWTP